MLKALRKVALGVVVLVAASAALLLSDLQHRHAGGATVKAAGHKWKIYFVQFNDVADVEESADGVKFGLAEAGLKEGRDFEIKTLNAQGDMPTVSALVDAAVTGGADLLVTFSTPTLQAAIRRAQGLPVVYTYVSSGLAAGAGKSNHEHAANVTGNNMLPNFDEAFAIVKKDFPHAHRLGTLYCPAETNMVVSRKVLDETAARLGYEMEYVTADTATDVPNAAAALMTRNIDLVLQLPGNLTASAFGSISSAGRQAHIPIIAFQSSQAQGSIVIVGRDYKDAGRQAAAMAARIMRGESPARIPLEDFEGTRLIVNLDVARELNIQLPADLVKSAHKVIGAPSGDR